MPPRSVEPAILMAPILIILATAILVGLLAGGSLRPFEGMRLHWWALAPMGLLLQAAPVPEFGPVDADLTGALILLVSYGTLLVFTGMNRRLPGAVLVFAGLALNLTVIAPNDGMPVDGVAMRVAGGETATIDGDAKHHLMSDEDVLSFLGDSIAVPPPAGLIMSAGDVVLYTGVMWFAIVTMLGRARQNVRPPARWFQMYRGKHLSPERRGLPRRTWMPQRTPVGAGRWGTAR